MRSVCLPVIAFFIQLSIHAQNKPITAEEAIAAGRRLELAMMRGEPTALSQLIDEDRFLEHIAVKSEEAQTPGFMKGFRTTFHMSDVSTGIVKTLAKGTYRILRTYERDGKRHLVMRAFGETGINYHDYLLVRVKDSVKADEMYVLITGEDLSSTMASYIDETVGKSKSIDELSKNVDAMVRLKSLSAAGDYEGAKRMADSCEPWVRSNRAFSILYLGACYHLGDSIYKKAILDYAAQHPDDGTIYLKMIDFYFLQKDYPKALQAVNQLDSAVGGDPFLNFFRATMLVKQQRTDEANDLYLKIFEYDPGMGYALPPVVHFYMKKEDREKAKSAIHQYETSGYAKQEVVDAIYTTYPSLKDQK